MKTKKMGQYLGMTLVTCAVASASSPLQTIWATESADLRRAPVLMEQATVRGKIAILEVRREGRTSRQGLRIQVWQKGQNAEEKRLLHETVTDEAGLFSLPLLGEGTYELKVEDFAVDLVVIPQSDDRKGQEEPKILLLVVPREALNLKRRSPPSAE